MSARRDYYFENALAVVALRKACESWRGTPFRERSSVKGAGGGVDCACFIGASFLEAGAVVQQITVPPYAVNHAEHSDDSMFRAWFEQPAVRERVRRVDEDEPHLDGDIVFPRVGRTEHHAGIRIGDSVYHVARPSGFCCMTVAQLDHIVASVPAMRGLRGLHPSRYRLTTFA
jgi:hypothetical protein